MKSQEYFKKMFGNILTRTKRNISRYLELLLNTAIRNPNMFYHHSVWRQLFLLHWQIKDIRTFTFLSYCHLLREERFLVFIYFIVFFFFYIVGEIVAHFPVKYTAKTHYASTTVKKKSLFCVLTDSMSKTSFHE